MKIRESYPPAVRAFSITVHNKSPWTYAYFRKKFNSHLPHPNTIRQWLKNSNLDNKSGLGKHSLEALEKTAKEMKENGEQLIVSLVMDEMAIQRYMMWCRSSNRFTGLIDCGSPTIKEDYNLASNVIVFMVCGINAKFEQPVAYYFIETLKSHEHSKLLLEIIGEISKRSIRIANVTFDGYYSNAAMCQELGAELKHKNGEYRPYIENPYDKSRIMIVFDPSHMIKLIRNNLATQSILLDESDREIKWQFFVDLVRHSQDNNLSTRGHVGDYFFVVRFRVDRGTIRP